MAQFGLSPASSPLPPLRRPKQILSIVDPATGNDVSDEILHSHDQCTSISRTGVVSRSDTKPTGSMARQDCLVSSPQNPVAAQFAAQVAATLFCPSSTHKEMETSKSDSGRLHCAAQGEGSSKQVTGQKTTSNQPQPPAVGDHSRQHAEERKRRVLSIVDPATGLDLSDEILGSHDNPEDTTSVVRVPYPYNPTQVASQKTTFNQHQATTGGDQSRQPSEERKRRVLSIVDPVTGSDLSDEILGSHDKPEDTTAGLRMPNPYGPTQTFQCDRDCTGTSAYPTSDSCVQQRTKQISIVDPLTGSDVSEDILRLRHETAQRKYAAKTSTCSEKSEVAAQFQALVAASLKEENTNTVAMQRANSDPTGQRQCVSNVLPSTPQENARAKPLNEIAAQFVAQVAETLKTSSPSKVHVQRSTSEPSSNRGLRTGALPYEQEPDVRVSPRVKASQCTAPAASGLICTSPRTTMLQHTSSNPHLDLRQTIQVPGTICSNTNTAYQSNSMILGDLGYPAHGSKPSTDSGTYLSSADSTKGNDSAFQIPGRVISSTIPISTATRTFSPPVVPMDDFATKMRTTEVSRCGKLEENIDTSPVGKKELVDRVGKITFCLKRELGRGGRSVVFKGKLDDGRQVAVKRLACTSTADADTTKKQLDKLNRELKIHAELEPFRHPNILGYYLTEIDHKDLYIALELCQGTLNDFVKEENKEWQTSLSPLQVNLEMAKGLEFLHSCNIAHRDLSPFNVLLVVKDNVIQKVCLSDFGSSKTTVNDMFSISADFGTNGFISPELWEKIRTIDPDDPASKYGTTASDVFALGCLFYYCFTLGKHPFGRAIDRQVNIATGKPPSCAHLSEKYFTFRSLTEQMVHKEPEMRPNMKDVVKDPGLWNSSKTLQFLQDASDMLENMIKEGKMDETWLKDPYLIPHGNWLNNLPPLFQKYLKSLKVAGKSMYVGTGGSARYLLRAIRNTEHHFRDHPEDVQKEIGITKDERASFWIEQCPGLLLKMFEKFKNDLPI